MSKENRAILEMLCCAALWSIAGIFIKLIPWNPFAVASLRSMVSGTVIAVYMAMKRYRFVPSRRALIAGLLEGGVYLCFVCANKLTTAANAIVLQFTSPVFIVIYSALFFKEKIQRSDLTVVLFTLAGIALFFFDQLQGGYILGNCVAILAGMIMAGMFMAIGALKGEERFSAVLIGQITAFLVGLPFVLGGKLNYTPTAVVSVLILGVFQLGISYILYAKSADYCPPLACCLLGALEPLLNPVWVFLFNGERPGIFALIGAVIVIGAITIWCIHKAKAEEKAHA
ncbi:MAG: EamA family transporter [Oscillospiraceae bacterium]|nr:EamA family transporter [Oscillospiraceae bacterium]